MVVIRLSRVGKKKQPSYRIVVQEKGRDPWSPHIEQLGHYNPRTKPATLVVDKERVMYWISKGAQPSDTLWNLFVDQKIVTGTKHRTIPMTKRRKAKLAGEKKEVAPAAAPAAEQAAT